MCGIAHSAMAGEIRVEKSWEDADAFHRCVWDNALEVTGRGTVTLVKSVMVQDEDGCTHYGNSETIKDPVRAKKQFLLDSTDCESAQLFAFYQRGFGAGFTVTCNGHLLPEGSRAEWNGWGVWKVPPERLKKELNEFVFSGGEGAFLIEHSRFPNRSARSSDGGKTWDFDRLGRNNDNGEYVIRLRLGRYPSVGRITSEVVSIPSLAGTGPIYPLLRAVKRIVLDVKGTSGRNGVFACEWRAGTTPSWDPESWTIWQPGQPGNSFNPGLAGGKTPTYFQWRVTLESGGPLKTPELRKVDLRADIDVAEPPPGMGKIRALSFTPVRFTRSSFPFSFQTPDTRTSMLLNNYRLGEVVAPGKTELEKFVLLRDWARNTAPEGWGMPVSFHCPQWDALIILATNKDRLELCMCTHYSTIFAQCALALGYTARQVILAHHCVAEIWSDQFHKWILMDTGNGPPALNCHFEKDGIPLNAAEMRGLWKSSRENEIDVVYTPPRGRVNGTNISPDQCGFENLRRFAVPLRNNFLGNPLPGELEQGMTESFCDQYIWWESGPVPVETPEHGKTSCRADDFYWTVNETAIELRMTEEKDALEVVLDTSAPNFARYSVQIDGSEWSQQPAFFLWKLNPGKNTIRAKSINQFNLECPANSAIVELSAF